MSAPYDDRSLPFHQTVAYWEDKARALQDKVRELEGVLVILRDNPVARRVLEPDNSSPGDVKADTEARLDALEAAIVRLDNTLGDVKTVLER